MLSLLGLIPLMPLAGFAVLALFGRRLPRAGVASVGVGSVGIAAALAVVVCIGYGFFFTQPAYTQTLWTWMQVGGYDIDVAFHLDALAVVMLLVVTGVSFLVHLYSSEFMAEDPGYARYFAYMNLFVASMLILVLANNLVLLYLGWEGVGICSYLLIGFWHEDPDNCLAARKAFTMTRVGDAAFAVGLFLLFTHLGTLHIQPLMHQAQASWATGSPLAIAAAALLLCGAVGKSAQLPLQTWLPDAMAGPTPVSALLHAATMVTAGVYLIARMHVLFQLAPPVQYAVAIIGALTLVLSGFSALTQRDIKRVLAYSTISQIGYMFLALGVGAWSAGIFHFMTHAVFKSLLFLSSGVVIMALDDEHDIYRMGGLRKHLPSAFWSYLIGSSALAALPLITAGFYSKDMILSQTWGSPKGAVWLWAMGVFGALLTGIYIFRSVFIAFYGEAHKLPDKRPGVRMLIPLTVLSVASLTAGFVEIPRVLGGVHAFTDLLHEALPASPAPEMAMHTELLLELVAAFTSVAGVYIAYRLFLRRAPSADALAGAADFSRLRRFWDTGWGFDWLYEHALVRPYSWIANTNRGDLVDAFYNALALTTRITHTVLSDTQSGRVRWYAGALAGGAVVVIAIAVLS